MRRFEFSADGSNKFWEIAQDAAELQLRWGRIGTQGQSQTKAFADAAKAAAALQKLVAEKLGKGYAEVAAGAVAALPISEKVTEISTSMATASHEAAATAATEVPIADAALVAVAAAVAATAASPEPASPREAEGIPPWLADGEPLDFDAAMALLLAPNAQGVVPVALPSRRFPGEPESSDGDADWAQVRQTLLERNELDLAATDADLRELLQQTWQRLEQGEAEGDAQSQALLLAIAVAVLRFGEAASLARWLVHRHGLEQALALLLDAQSYAVRVLDLYLGGKRELRVTRTVEEPSSSGWWAMLSAEERRFRRYLAQADADTYARCVALIRARLPTLHPARQVVTALLLPDQPELSDALARQLLAGEAPRVAHWLQLTATDRAVLASLQVKKFEYTNLHRSGQMLATVLQERRLDAVPMLAADRAGALAGEVLALIGLPESLEHLARAAAESKECQLRLARAVQRWPLAGIAGLARVVAAGGREAGTLMPLLRRLLMENPGAHARLQPWLKEPALSLVNTLQAQLDGPAQVAGQDELPAVLADPPWLRPRRTVLRVNGLAPLPLPPEDHWDDAAERERCATLRDWERRRYEGMQQDLPKLVFEFGFDAGRSGGRDYPLVKEVSAQAVHALEAGDADAFCRIWNELRANPNFDHLGVNAAVLCYLPETLQLELWNRLAGANTRDSFISLMAARFGLRAWPGVLRAIQRDLPALMGLAQHFADVELATVMARALVKLKTQRVQARRWLLRYPQHAAAGLIAAAIGKDGEARDCAGEALRLLAANGHEALLRQTAAHYGRDEVLAAVQQMLAEDPLDRFPTRRPPLPPFWAARAWHRPVLAGSGNSLPESVLDAIGTMLMFPAGEGRYAGLEQLRAACTPASLAEFAWDLFNAWLASGGSAKDNWALFALGVLGDDDSARRLTPLIRAWPGEAAGARAVAALDVLAGIGSDVALLQLNGIAQKVKFKQLQDKAQEKIGAIAAARELSSDELEDRLAPDLGLDAAGTLQLDFGARQFRVGFDEGLKPYVRGADGKRLADLPKPRQDDDAALAAAASERFKRLKKDVRTIAAQQVLRLETAMCTRRRWDEAVFRQYLATHPLLRHLVQRLVWGVYAMDSIEDKQGGTLLHGFRVAEDGSFTDAQDTALPLPRAENIRVGLPHVLELPTRQSAEFGQLFADYELIQPFVQLGRDSYTLSDKERSGGQLLRWQGRKVASTRLLALLDRGWRRGDAESGCNWYFYRELPGGMLAELRFTPGILVGALNHHSEQELQELEISASAGGTPLAQLDPIIASELIRDVQVVAAA